MTYTEKSRNIANEASIAVMVLLNPDATDSEFWPLKPAAQSPLTSETEFAARKLRPVGVVGLCGTKAQSAFKELLPDPVVRAIGTAFIEYVRVSLGQGFVEQLAAEVNRRAAEVEAGDFVQFAESLWALEDPRTEA
jgi:hypothetical protein